MNVEIGAEAAQFPGKEYINGIAVAVHCTVYSNSRNYIAQFLFDNLVYVNLIQGNGHSFFK